MAKKQRYYVVWEGLKTGIFDDWKNVKPRLKVIREPATKLLIHWTKHRSLLKQDLLWEPIQLKRMSHKKIDIQHSKDSIAVDAACEGNPHPEYQGVDPHSGAKLFIRDL